MLVSASLLLSLLGILQGAEPVSHTDYLVYIGTYTRGSDSQGIYRMRLNAQTGEMTDLQTAASAVNPSFLAVHPAATALYAVSEIEQLDGKPTGGVAAFRIDRATGNLTPLNEQPSGGAGPCYVAVNSSGQVLLVANYGGGSVASLPIAADGALQPAATIVQHTGRSVNEKRQKEPHAHSFQFGPDGAFAYAPDLGLDQVKIYRVNDADATLQPAEPGYASTAAGAGPRHIDFHPSGRFAYVIDELDSTVTVFNRDARTGSLSAVQMISTLPPGATGTNYPADIHVHPSGKYLYGSNRGHDSIAVYQIDQESGRLTAVQHQSTLGKTPRNFGIEPGGRVLLAENQQTGTIHSFLIDPATGRLTPTQYKIDVPRPVCVQFVAWPLQ